MWRRSSFCSTEACIQVDESPEKTMVAIRNTGWPSRMILVPRVEWDAFIAGVKAGEFDEFDE